MILQHDDPHSSSAMLGIKVRKSFSVSAAELGHAGRTHAPRICVLFESTRNYRDHLKIAVVGIALSRQRT